MKWLHRLRSAARLTPGERLALAEAWVLYVATHLALRLWPLPRVLAVAERRLWPRPSRAAANVSPDRLAWLVDVAGRRTPIRPTCLTRAVVLRSVLARRGVACTLRIGVVGGAARLQANAWVEEGHRVLGESSDLDRWAPLAVWPARGAPPS